MHLHVNASYKNKGRSIDLPVGGYAQKNREPFHMDCSNFNLKGVSCGGKEGHSSYCLVGFVPHWCLKPVNPELFVSKLKGHWTSITSIFLYLTL